MDQWSPYGTFQLHVNAKIKDRTRFDRHGSTSFGEPDSRQTSIFLNITVTTKNCSALRYFKNSEDEVELSQTQPKPGRWVSL
jgi:hypothetical protein